MIKGKTKSGFTYEIPKKRLDNYELIEALGEVEVNPIALPKAVNLSLGKEQAEKLKEHLRDKDGIVPVEKLASELMEIFEGGQETKNS